MVSEASVFNLTAEEYVFLASLAGGKHLLGVENPFRGALEEEIRVRWQEISLHLLERGLLKQRGEKDFEISRQASTVLETCFNPVVSFLIHARTPVGEKKKESFHVDKAQAVQQLVLSSGKYQLRHLAEIGELYDLLLEVFQLENQPKAPGEEIDLAVKELSAVLETLVFDDIFSTPQSLATEGKRTGGRESWKFFEDYQVTGTIIAAAWRGSGWETAALGLLVANDGVWRVCPQKRYGQDRVKFRPVSAEEAQEKIRRLLNRMLPIRL